MFHSKCHLIRKKLMKYEAFFKRKFSHPSIMNKVPKPIFQEKKNKKASVKVAYSKPVFKISNTGS